MLLSKRETTNHPTSDGFLSRNYKVFYTISNVLFMCFFLEEDWALLGVLGSN